MSKEEEVFYGAVRRRESLKIAHKRQQEPLPSFIVQEPLESTPDASAALARDLASLETKKKATLETPPAGEVKLGKLPSLVLLIALAFMAALFFIVGFLTCYTLFPPYGGFSLKNAVSQAVTPQSAGIQEPQHSLNTQPLSYAQRQQQLAQASGRDKPESNLLIEAEKQSLSQAKFQAQSSVFRVINSITSKLRNTLGDKMGSIAAPLTTGIAQTLAQQKTDEAFTKVETKIRGDSTKPQAGALPEAPYSQGSASPQYEKTMSPHGEAEKSAAHSPQAMFTIQLREFQDLPSAEAYIQDLKKQGFSECYYTRVWRSGGMIYSVKAGHYKTSADALNASKILREQGRQGTRVVLVPSDEAPLTPKGGVHE